jgi:SNF2 family DNA or RNA helicase
MRIGDSSTTTSSETTSKDQGLAKSRMLILQAMSELRQIASIPERPSDGQFVSPKLEILMDSLQEAISNGHKALVFVNFLDAISLIGERLERASIPYLTISGSTKNRSEICETFQNDPEVSLLLMTLKTGGVGLNLTAAEYVFIYEPWWNYAAEQQAVDRAHRIGQKNTVFSYKLITSGTIEEKIIELQERKKEFAQALLDGESSSEKHLSEEDIDYLFG